MRVTRLALSAHYDDVLAAGGAEGQAGQCRLALKPLAWRDGWARHIRVPGPRRVHGARETPRGGRGQMEAGNGRAAGRRVCVVEPPRRGRPPTSERMVAPSPLVTGSPILEIGVLPGVPETTPRVAPRPLYYVRTRRLQGAPLQGGEEFGRTAVSRPGPTPTHSFCPW